MFCISSFYGVLCLKKKKRDLYKVKLLYVDLSVDTSIEHFFQVQYKYSPLCCLFYCFCWNLYENYRIFRTYFFYLARSQFSILRKKENNQIFKVRHYINKNNRGAGNSTVWVRILKEDGFLFHFHFLCFGKWKSAQHMMRLIIANLYMQFMSKTHSECDHMAHK